MTGARDHPRIPLTLRVSLALPSGHGLEGVSENVSCAGFQMRGAPWAAAELFPGGHQPGPRQRVKVAARLQADGEGERGVAVCCAAVFARRVSETEFQFGFQFHDLAPGTLQWLEARIASALRRAAAD